MKEKPNYHFRPVEETAYLVTKKNHKAGKCLEGDIFAQVQSPDLKSDEFFNARVCNVCGNPFVDGFKTAKRDTNLELYISRYSETQNKFTHFHLLSENGERPENPYLSIMYIQPNLFLSCYAPDQKVLYVFNKKQRDMQVKMFEQMKKDPKLSKDSDIEVLANLGEALAGHHILTPGEILLRTIYGIFYDSMKPLPPKLMDLVKESIGGTEAHRVLMDEIKNANVVDSKFSLL